MPDTHVLIVEDDQFLQQIYRGSLEKDGYVVELVATGTEARQKLKAGGWDVLILDLNLPDVPGMQILEQMNADGLIQTTPVLVLTNYSEEEYADKCAKLGVKGFYTKSNLSFETILSHIKRLTKDRPSASAARAPVTSVPADAATSVADTKPADNGVKRIMVVEDDAFLSEIYRQNLAERGYDVTTRPSGKDALSTLRADDRWSIILLDLLMPEMDGFTVLEHLKEMGITKKIPVIVLTNLSQENDQKKALELGATDFAIKSELSFDEIVQRVESTLKKFQAQPPA